MRVRIFDRVSWLVLGAAFVNVARLVVDLDWVRGPRFSWIATVPPSPSSYVALLAPPVLLLLYVVARRRLIASK